MSKRIVVTGASGLVGSALAAPLKAEGYEVVPLKHSLDHKKDAPGVLHWSAEKKIIPVEAFVNCSAVIHLAGANIADKRWTPVYKKEIYESRVNATRFLAESLAKLPHPPPVLISASAVGYYGTHASGVSVNEDSPAGDDFLAGVCRDWERAAGSAAENNIRTVFLRIGAVLGRQGGALAKMLPIFKLGLGGPLGSGKQIMSWVDIDEIAPVILFCLKNPSISGAVNCVSPQTVSNSEFTKTLAGVLRRPAVLPAPDFALRLALGEMADALLLGGARVVPKKLTSAGYAFRCPDLRSTLEKHLLN